MKISAKKQSSLKGNPKSKNKLPHFFTNFFSVIFVFAVLVLLYGQVAGNSKKDTPISLSEVATLINSDTVKNIEVAGRDITIELTDGSFKKTRKEDESSLTETLKNYGVTML
jgi:hypothetical protein